MNEANPGKAPRKAKARKTAALIIFSLIAAVILSGIAAYKYRHTFSTEKWLNAPEDRTRIVADMLKKHDLAGMTKDEVILLLGEEEEYANSRTSFKMSREYFDPESTIVYYLGVDFMDDRWLIISLEDDVVRDCRIDVT